MTPRALLFAALSCWLLNEAAVAATFDVTLERGAAAETAFAVVGRFPTPVTRVALFHFPVAERPGGQSESIRELRAFDARGREMSVKYAGDGSWNSAQPISRISYRVVADHDQVRWGPGKDEVATHFDRTWFFVGNAFFVMDPAYASPVRVRFRLPAGWRVTAPWTRDGDHWIAASADRLQQNAFAVGLDPPLRMEMDGVAITLLVDSRLGRTSVKLQELLRALPTLYTRFWGQNLPGPVTIFAFADPQTDGGAFRDSFALRVAEAQTAVDERVWTHLLAHELMHLWLGSGRIRGDATGSIYWFLEGATDYLAARLLYDAHLIDQNTYETRLANFVRRYLLGVRLTPGTSLAAAGADKFRHYELIYGGGAVFALLFDRELSAARPGAFDSLMAELYREADTPLDQARLLALLDRRSAGKASELLRWIDSAPGIDSLVQRLARAGLHTAVFTADEIYIGLER